ncbi:unnamed protein product [Rotaria magnacalcarata]|uniref:Uncharacterized protein n=3 Tax=Rotaria magnacalcarata TaxID=392030 RepID=A0A8S2RCX8_9BILA|nr:unnamed protein product [Rotaria magnacalcarata]
MGVKNKVIDITDEFDFDFEMDKNILHKDPNLYTTFFSPISNATSQGEENNKSSDSEDQDESCDVVLTKCLTDISEIVQYLKEVVELNEVVGCHLLKFLNGIDATNFIEAVDSTKQFGSIAKTLDHHFIRLISLFCDYQRILLPRASFECFMGESEIDDERLVVGSTRYSSVIQPSERLYIHPCFGLEGFSKLCEVYQTSLFKCYCRLLPLNTVWYYADFGLLDYEWYCHTVGLERILNEYEKKLFKVNMNFPSTEDRNCRTNLTFVFTIDEFKQNLATRFSSALWLEAIDFSKLVIAGECVLNAMCRSPFSDTKQQDVNLLYYAEDTSDFETIVHSTVNILKKIISFDLTHAITMEKVPGVSTYNVFLPCNVRLSFSSISTGNAKQPLSHILHNFDMDICQVVFTVPINFDGDFELMMAQEETPLYRVEHHQYINDDGDIQIATKEFYRVSAHNVDTFRLQEKFMSFVCPQLLQYK